MATEFGRALPPMPSYETASSEVLLVQIGALATFAEVREWDERASQQVAAINKYLSALGAQEAQVESAEERAIAAAGQQSLMRRLLGMGPEVKAARAWRAQSVKTRAALADVADRLQAAIDKTPNSREEQNEMLQDL